MKQLFGILIVALLPMSASAGIITFNLAGDSGDGAEGAALDGLDIGSVTKGGVTATLSTFVPPTSAITTGLVMNQTSGAFGVNQLGDGCDVSSQVDSNCGNEIILFSFSEMVELLSVTLTSYSPSDTANIDFENVANPDFTFASSPSTTPIGALVGGLDDRFLISSISGNGFSIDRFTIATVPEPAPIGLLMLGLLGIRMARRSRA